MVLSLQRIGDYFHIAPVVESYRISQKLEDKHIHLVLQDSSRSLRSWLPFTHTSFFPRSAIAWELVETEGDPQAALSETRNWFEGLLSWGPTHFLDVSPNRTSQHLAQLLRGRNVEPIPLKGNYLSYLNEVWVEADAPVMSWRDVLAELLAVSGSLTPQRRLQIRKAVSFQITTSDVRKDWPLESWLELAKLFKSAFWKVTILAAPFEVQEICNRCPELRPFLYVCNWKQAQTALENSDILITGDTAMMHLAANLGTPILALYRGPANPHKIMPSQIGARIVRGEVSPAQVFRLGIEQVTGRESCSEEEFQVSVVRKGSNGKLLLKDQPALQGGCVKLRSDVQLSPAQKSAFDQIVWGFYLDERHEEVIPPFGSAVQELIQIESFLPSDISCLRKSLEILEGGEDYLQILNERYLVFCRQGHESDIKRMRLLSDLSHVAASLPLQGFVTDAGRKFLTALQTARTEGDFFQAARGLKEGISELFFLLQIQRKLLQGLIIKIEERRHRVSGTREVPSAST